MKKEDFKLGERYKWKALDEHNVEGITNPLIFIGSGKDSAKLYPKHTQYRKQAEFVIMDGETGWFTIGDDILFTPLSKLAKAMK